MRGPTLFSERKAAWRCRIGLAPKPRRGQRERGTYAMGSPRNLGDPVFSVLISDGLADQLVPDRGGCVRSRGSEHRAQGRYRQAKATKRGGMVHRKSELSIVPRKSGNAAPGGPGGGKRQPVDGFFFEGKDAENAKSHKCLNKTAKDSETGEGSA